MGVQSGDEVVALMTDHSFDENPWSHEFWNLTRQGEYIRKYGLEVAKTKAKSAGTKFGAPAPRGGFPHHHQRPLQVIVQRRTIVQGGGGGVIGAGSSGDGPPS